MLFEEFTEKNVQTKGPSVSIYKAGTIGMNAACIDQHFKNVEHVVFLFDRERNRIGIKPISKELPHSYRIRKTGNRGNGNLAATSFLKKMVKIDYKKQGAKSYKFVWNEKEKLLEVDLNSPLK